MSVLLKLVCFDCRVSTYIGSSNTMIVEKPEEVGKFLWKHQNHNLETISDSGQYQDSFLFGFPEDE